MDQAQQNALGHPNWIECATTNLDAAEAFYGKVFGWQSERMAPSNGPAYAVQKLNGKTVAGIFEIPQQLMDKGIPPHWATYLEVGDVDACLKAVTANGGKILEGAKTEAGIGTFAVIQDPTGGVIHVWKSGGTQGMEAYNVPGAMNWNELCTKESEAAADFYKNVFGFEVVEHDDAPGYTLLEIEKQPVAGILKQTSQMDDMPATWDVYFASEDVPATLKSVKAAGGKILRDSFEVPGGEMAVVQDPFGAVFEVMSMKRPDSP